MISKTIESCEMSYVKLFSTDYEDDNRIRFRNKNIRDMYSHNFCYIKKQEKELKLRGIFEEEIALSKGEKQDFSNLWINGKVNPAILSYIKYPSKLSVFGVYEFDLAQVNSIKTTGNFKLRKVSELTDFDEQVKIDEDADGQVLGHDFCVRRVYGKSPVYLKNFGLEGYLCLEGDEVIGRCDLYVENGVAKIEDLCVLGEKQGRGAGKFLIKSLLERALELGAHTAYLVTDEADFAKKMYLKMGFKKMGEIEEVLFYLK